MRIVMRLSMTLGVLVLPCFSSANLYSQADQSSLRLLEAEIPRHIRAIRERHQKRGISLEGEIKEFDLLAGKKLVGHGKFLYKRAKDCRLKLFIDQIAPPQCP